MRSSTALVVMALVLAFLILISYAFHVKSNLNESIQVPKKPWLIPQGDFFAVTDSLAYNHLRADFNMIQLDPTGEKYITVEGYGEALDFVEYNLENDTLHVYSSLRADSIYLVNISNEPNLQVRVGSMNLKSIIIEEKGNIFHSLAPYGSDEDGIELYHPELWDKYALKNDSLTLELRGGRASLLAELGIVDLIVNDGYRSNSSNYNSLSIIGAIQKLSVSNFASQSIIDGSSLVTSVFEYTESQNSSTNGRIVLRCNKTLNAKLYHDVDIFYLGEPEVSKSEEGYGRIMKFSDANVVRSRQLPLLRG